jgi:hypothetical protein
MDTLGLHIHIVNHKDFFNYYYKKALFSNNDYKLYTLNEKRIVDIAMNEYKRMRVDEANNRFKLFELPENFRQRRS